MTLLRGALVAIALLPVGCRRETATVASEPPSSKAASSSAVVAPAPRDRTIDVTFVVASDTHFGFAGIEESNQRLVDRVNGLAGRSWPHGGNLGKLSGLVITGDLTEWGHAAEWERFVAFYGDEGKVKVPVFEMIGNHDKVAGKHVETEVAKRHGGARYYAWSWGGLRLVSLGEAPDDEGLEYLAKEVATRPKDEPVMIFFHLALQGPWSTEHWFGQGDFKQRMAKILGRKNVAAIVHGHQHVHGHEKWSGFDVLKAGAAKHRDNSFFVVRATTTKLSVAWLDFANDAWIGTFEKTL
jgi:predicted MPP superfamily phosphohydrolase